MGKLDVKWTIQLNGAKLRQQVDQAVFDGVKEVFKRDIEPDAKRGSPAVTGHNRASITVEVNKTAKGVEAQIYSQSGYGGFLELGTRFMRARPYIAPAFNKFKDRISKVCGRNIARIAKGGKLNG